MHQFEISIWIAAAGGLVAISALWSVVRYRYVSAREREQRQTPDIEQDESNSNFVELGDMEQDESNSNFVKMSVVEKDESNSNSYEVSSSSWRDDDVDC